jgi:predicted metal-binding membrane protein
MTENITETILKRDRNIVVLGLMGVIGVAWSYTIYCMNK